jgi:hypothetical protein
MNINFKRTLKIFKDPQLINGFRKRNKKVISILNQSFRISFNNDNKTLSKNAFKNF